MSDQTGSTRIGDILVERGVITRQQLREAVEIQLARQLINVKESKRPPQPLGEILIELGYIDRKQLNRTLSWQKRLRKATLVMSFVAPLLTTACGGGGGASAASPSGGNKTPASAVSSVMVGNSSSTASPEFESHSSSSSAISFSSPASSIPPSSQASVSISGPVMLKWEVPSARENGDYLGIEEVGGYEIRYREIGQDTYSSVRIDGGYVNNHYFNHLQGKLEFEIAAYDTNGLFSRFVPIKPQENATE